MAIHDARAQAVSLRQIKRFGGKGKLRRGTSERDCWVGIVDYRPRDRELVTEGARRALIAAKGLTIPPDREEDVIVFKGEVWRFSAPIAGPRPNGVVFFYDCEVVYDSRNS